LNESQILDVVLGTYEKAKDIWSGAAKIYKAFKGEGPVETRPGECANTTVLVFGNNNTVIADSNTARLYNDDRVREALTRAAKPLLCEGVEKLDVTRANNLVERLERSDVGQLPAQDLTSSTEADTAGKPRDLWVRVVTDSES